MYQINKQSRNVLITPAEVIKQASVMEKVDQRIIEQSIMVAEERFVRPALGYNYYKALCDSKNLVITSGNKVAQQVLYDTAYPDKKYELKVGDISNAVEYMSEDDAALWNYILWKLCAESVVFMALSAGYVQLGAAGAMHTSPTPGGLTGAATNTPELRSVKWRMDKILMDIIDPLTESMHLWLCKQKDADSELYPDYKKHCDCDAKGTSIKRKTNFITGLYDDSDRNYLDYRDPNVFPDSKCCW